MSTSRLRSSVASVGCVASPRRAAAAGSPAKPRRAARPARTPSPASRRSRSCARNASACVDRRLRDRRRAPARAARGSTRARTCSSISAICSWRPSRAASRYWSAMRSAAPTRPPEYSVCEPVSVAMYEFCLAERQVAEQRPEPAEPRARRAILEVAHALGERARWCRARTCSESGSVKPPPPLNGDAKVRV